MPKSRYINWKVWRSCWLLVLLRDVWQFRTPWFFIWISCGGPGLCDGGYWTPREMYGIQVYWKHTPRWDVGDGNILFHRGDTFLSFTRYAEQDTLGPRQEQD